MSYCRFENTYRDLMDCFHNMGEELSDSEHNYRKRLYDLCSDIVNKFKDTDFDEIQNENNEDEDDE